MSVACPMPTVAHHDKTTQPVLVGEEMKKDASMQVEDNTWWSNSCLEVAIAYRLDNSNHPLDLFERTALVSPMQNGTLNATLQDLNTNSGHICDGGARQWSLRRRTNARNVLDYYPPCLYEPDVRTPRSVLQLFQNI